MIAPKAKNIDEYMISFPEDTQKILQQIRTVIKHAAPGAEEKISYAIPTFTFKGKNLVHFAAFKNHIGFYPAPVGMEAFKEQLSPFKTGKGSAQFPLDKPMPLELITSIVEFRMSDILTGNKKKA